AKRRRRAGRLGGGSSHGDSVGFAGLRMPPLHGHEECVIVLPGPPRRLNRSHRLRRRARPGMMGPRPCIRAHPRSTSMRKLRWIPAILAPAVFLAACATAPTGRTQLILVSDADMNRMGVTAFDQIKSQGKVSGNKGQQRYVSCVANALIAQLPSPWRQQPWEVVVIQDDTANAFALPGGKVGVHTGLLKVAANQDQLASVIGHEL